MNTGRTYPFTVRHIHNIDGSARIFKIEIAGKGYTQHEEKAVFT